MSASNSRKYGTRAMAQLVAWGAVDEATARAAGLVERTVAGRPALVIPYTDIDGTPLHSDNGALFYRARFLTPAAQPLTGRVVRYYQPPESGVRPYLPPLLPWATISSDTAQSIVITEGEAKALRAAQDGIVAIGLGGVFNWVGALRGTLESTLARIAWAGRKVFLAFDSDAATNLNVQLAESRLADVLTLQHGADVRVVRLPHAPDGKEGLDTYLARHGAAAFEKLCDAASELSEIDRCVLQMNRKLAWVEFERAAYDAEEDMFIPRDTLLSGSRFSADKKYVLPKMGPNTRATALKEIQVARVWLTSPLARRYSRVIFAPGQPEEVLDQSGSTALNFWKGWNEIHGVTEDDLRVAAFLRLTEFLTSNVQEEHRGFLFKLLAYKAQNPMVKVAICPIFIGQQGCGKSLWNECVKEIFAQYGAIIRSSDFSERHFNALERSIWIAIDDAKTEDVQKFIPELRVLISGEEHTLNEKFRPLRQIKTYTMYSMSSNEHGVGSFAGDDRRMFVVHTPDTQHDDETRRLYRYLGTRGEWRKTQGPNAVMGYLLDYDLKGWEPPDRAPETAEKVMASYEGMSDVQRLAAEMKDAEENRVLEWLYSAYMWARERATGNSATAAWAAMLERNIPKMRVRDIYTAKELQLMFPAILAPQGDKGMNLTASTVSRQLRDAGVKMLVNADNPRGFLYGGITQQFLIVANFAEWSQPVKQADVERHLKEAPLFGDLMERGKRG